MSMDAVKHWKLLRLTAIFAIPLCIWFVYSILNLAHADYAIVIAWLQHPFNAILMIAFIAINFFHGALGAQEIVEDYLHAPGLKKMTLCGLNLAFILIALISIGAVVKIAFL